ncbi:MAG: lipoyl(octanoyl) transferase LipB [Prevotellaceae bacterium]|jgi:lipoyl(octanoyl) transferase|nr:lipoyl(octanoyl) transferase LipB [Prevotellaceae bacterium]
MKEAGERPATVAWADLGLVDYRRAWQLQEALLDSLREDAPAKAREAGYLLLLEHPHVYTLGRNGKPDNLLASAAQLQARGAELIRVNRGGDITYHGPGQLVAYPILKLHRLGIGARDYVHRLEEVAIRTVGAYGLTGERLEKASGVWIAPGTPAARKICAVGVRCSRAITMHGFALNVSTDLSCFGYINPCGFADKGVTSLQKETGKPAGLDDVKQLVLRHFAAVFAVELTALNPNSANF